jgi:hypothetical protein
MTCDFYLRGNKHFRATVDSGASMSLINDKYAQELIDGGFAILAKSNTNAVFQGADGSSFTPSGDIILDLHVDSYSIKHTFVRIQGLSQQVLVGLDFLITVDAVIDISRKEMYIGVWDGKCLTLSTHSCEIDTSSMNDSRLYAVKAPLTIPANTGKVVEVKHAVNDPLYAAD